MQRRSSADKPVNRKTLQRLLVHAEALKLEFESAPEAEKPDLLFQWNDAVSELADALQKFKVASE